MTAAHAHASDYVVCYRLTQDKNQFKLRLWEPAPQTTGDDESRLPYLYVANYTFQTQQDAEAFLRDYLLTNGAFDLPEDHLPAEGQIEILPYPTWATEDP